MTAVTPGRPNSSEAERPTLAVRRRAEALASLHLSRLGEFLAIPSVSGQPSHRTDVGAAARWLRDHLGSMGLEAILHSTAGHPVVTAALRTAGADAPTLLIYGHYDVQPPEPLEAWSSPPFEGTVVDGRLVARGAIDDKGQLFIHIAAVDAWLKERGALPVNLVFLVEGEEEVASPNLLPFLREKARTLACDAVVISDTTMLDPTTPTLGASLRGGVKFEIRVRTADVDLHSGLFGGVAPNAAAVLTSLLASLHEQPGGRVAVPGFYDDVQVDSRLREEMERVPVDPQELASAAGVERWVGEPGRSFSERRWTRPTVEVNGVVSGYTGQGPKSVVPARASAKVSCRLVPGQRPGPVAEAVRNHLVERCPAGVELEIDILPGTARPWTTDPRSRIVGAGRSALRAVFGREPVLAGEGGSIPVVPELEEMLGAPVLLLGFGLPSSNAHAPDEWLDLTLFHRGVATAIELYQAFADEGRDRAEAPPREEGER